MLEENLIDDRKKGTEAWIDSRVLGLLLSRQGLAESWQRL